MMKKRNESRAPQRSQSFHNLADVAKRLKISVKTVRRLVDRGELVVHRFGSSLRVSDTDLTAFERINRIG